MVSFAYVGHKEASVLKRDCFTTCLKLTTNFTDLQVENLSFSNVKQLLLSNVFAGKGGWKTSIKAHTSPPSPLALLILVCVLKPSPSGAR